MTADLRATCARQGDSQNYTLADQIGNKLKISVLKIVVIALLKSDDV